MRLLRRKRNSEELKIRRLYELYKGYIYSIAYDIIKDSYLAEDIVQEVFIKIMDNINNIGEVNSAQTKNYIIIVTKNTAIDMYRNSVKRNGHELNIENCSDISYSVSSFDCIGELDIKRKIASLPEIYKDVILLKYFNDLDNESIAKALSITEDNVRQRLRRGKAMLENRMEERDVC